MDWQANCRCLFRVSRSSYRSWGAGRAGDTAGVASDKERANHRETPKACPENIRELDSDPQRIMADIPSVDTVIFVDDFIGTGAQFSEFLQDTGLISFLSSHCFIYGCLAGHNTGVDLLRKDFPSLQVATVERLDDTHALFHANGGSFPDEFNSADCARDFYYGLLDDRSFNIPGPIRRGFGHLEIVYDSSTRFPIIRFPFSGGITRTSGIIFSIGDVT